mmetsp:Transcript_6893/g.9550  ORF Transcript_6893/g.9550 Transcript_6893/m.9550 type:complete len:219 (-) Transcript_6893:526-1182(-)
MGSCLVSPFHEFPSYFRPVTTLFGAFQPVTIIVLKWVAVFPVKITRNHHRNTCQCPVSRSFPKQGHVSGDIRGVFGEIETSFGEFYSFVSRVAWRVRSLKGSDVRDFASEPVYAIKGSAIPFEYLLRPVWKAACPFVQKAVVKFVEIAVARDSILVFEEILRGLWTVWTNFFRVREILRSRRIMRIYSAVALTPGAIRVWCVSQLFLGRNGPVTQAPC